MYGEPSVPYQRVGKYSNQLPNIPSRTLVDTVNYQVKSTNEGILQNSAMFIFAKVLKLTT